ncbi:MAG TPA: hypothetical protein V6D00_12120 [Pantanalinema sp.]
MPAATIRLSLTLLDAAGGVVANRVLQAGQATASFELPTGSGYLLTVQADAAAFARVAVGTSDRFSVARNRVTDLGVELSPTIQRFAGPVEGAEASDAARAASLALPNAIALDGETVLVVDEESDTIRRLDASGRNQPLFAANGEPADAEAPALQTKLTAPFGVHADASGNIWFAHNTSQLCFVPKQSGTFYGRDREAGHVYPILAGNGTDPSLSLGDSMTLESSGSLLVTSRSEGKIYRLSSPAASTASLALVVGGGASFPATDSIGTNVVPDPLSLSLNTTFLGMATDANDNMAIADSGRRKIFLVCRKSGPLFGQQMEAGQVYLLRQWATGGPKPRQVAFDRDGHLYFTVNSDHTVRRIDRATRAETIVAGQAGVFTSSGTLGNDAPARQATLNTPMGLVISPGNRLLIADKLNHQIRLIHL